MKRISTLLTVVVSFLLMQQAHAQAVVFTKLNTAYKQNFDSLANSGKASTMPYGWYFYETDVNANTIYSADSGSSTTGDTYSYGHSGSTERALGTLASSKLKSYIGMQFKNSTGATVTSITVSFTVEMWRLGATGRGADSMYATMSTSAGSLSASSGWTSIPSLTFISPVVGGTVGLTDGNSSTYQTKVNVTLTGLSIPDGQTAWLRWYDPNVASNDDGLAIDDFSLTLKGYKGYKIREAKFPLTLGISDTSKIGLWKGIVTSPNYASAGLNFTMNDSTGNVSAIGLNTFGYTPATGDSVAVYGKVQSLNFLTYIAIDSVAKLNSGNSVGTPKVVKSITNDTLESGLVRINNLSLASGYKWDTTGASKTGGFMTTVTNGTTSFSVWINKNSNVYGKAAPKFPFNLTGIVLQNGTLLTNGYYLWLRSLSDVDTIKVPLYKISQIRGQNATTGVSDSAGNKKEIYLKGIVYSPSLTTPNLQFSLIDNTGAITVFSSAVKNYTPAVGDSILARGVVTQFNGLTELTADSIRTLTKSSASLKSPKVITKADESVESDLVMFKNAYIVDSTKWLPTGSGFNVNYTNGKDTIQLHIYNNTDLYKLKSAPKGIFNITGIGGQFKSGSPYLSGYQIFPRSLADFQKVFLATPLYKIRQLKGENVSGVADSVNKGKGFIKGVVHSPSFSATSLQFSLIDSTGAITIFSSKIKYYTPSVGDSLLVKGTLTQFNGLSEYTADSIITLTKGSWLKTPRLTKTLGENEESDLIMIDSVHITDTTAWVASGSGFNVNITNGKDTFSMRITNTTDLYKMHAIKGMFNVTGIGTQFKSSSPYTSGYQIEPRSSADIQQIIILGFIPKPIYKIRQLKGVNSLGVADSLNKGKGFIKGVVHSPSFSATSLQFSLIDSTGGITIFSSKIKYYTPSVGDSLLVKGTLTQFNGLSEYTADTIIALAKGSWMKSARLVKSLGENEESDLITIDSVSIVDTTAWTGSGSGFNVNITDGKNTFSMRITNTTDLYKMHAIKGKFNVTGIGTQFQSSSPYTTGYQIEPRSSADIKPLNIIVVTIPKLPLYKISQVRGQNAITGVADSATSKHKFFLKGIVQSPAFNTGEEFSLLDNTGAIIVYSSGKLDGYTSNIGDSVQVRGVLTQFNGLTEVTIDSVAKLTTGTVKPTATVVTQLSESTEAHLVQFRNAYLVDDSKWIPSGSGFDVAVTNGKDTIQLRVASVTDVFKMAALKGRFNVTGIAGQYKAGSPYIGGYELWERGSFDIQFIPAKLYTISQVKGYNSTTGVADSINTFCFLKGVVQSRDLSSDPTLQAFTLQDNTGGITIMDAGAVNAYSPKVGDSIMVRGTVAQVAGLTYFMIDSVKTMAGGTAISPVVVSSLSESTESKLATLKGYSLVDSTAWTTTSGADFKVKAANGTDTITIYIVKGTNLYANSARPHGKFDITGVGSQNDFTAPYLQNYLLIPRTTADITLITDIREEDHSAGQVSMYPNPVQTTLTVNAGFRMASVKVMSITGQIVAEAVPGAQMTTIDMNGLKAGVYFVRIDSADSHIIQKIVKQ
jgi:DNA/RNA endonuclease YhcR with UshA esterase domain